VVLRDFWTEFKAAIEAAKEHRTSEILDALNETLSAALFPARADGTDPRACPACGAGRLSLKLGKSGPFIGCSNYPECRHTRPFALGAEGADAPPSGPILLGKDPETGAEVTVREGRFGAYIQLGEGEKPKRASLPKGERPHEIALARALALLSLPREIGRHPESGEPIFAGIGRYGPYVNHEKTYATLENLEDVFTIGINRAVDVLANKRSAAGGRFGRSAPPGKTLGAHPDGGEITLRDGKYGPYVNWGKVNASLPKGADAAELTLEGALGLLAERIAAMGGLPDKPARGPRAASGKSAQAKAKPANAKTTAAKAAKAPQKRATRKPPLAAKAAGG